MHISLYRRFRPDTFEKMVRQEHVVRVLKNQIEQGTVGHAYLFCGPRGTGKTSVARIFARAVNCEHPVNGSPCGQCPACKSLDNSLDVTEIDAASNNGVAEMRDLREKVQYPPTVGKYKVYIVDEVHMLTDSAFNALLKTLEEPPAHVIFILATTEPHKIPATILSRCMRLDFKLIPTKDLEQHLKSILDEIGKPYEEEAVSLIARAGAGSDRDMLSIAEMCISYSEKLTYVDVTAALGAADFATTAELVGAVLRSDVSAALSVAEAALSEGKAVGVLLRDILDALRQIAVAKTCRDAENLLSLPKELYAKVKEIADASEGRAILRATEIFAGAESGLRFASSPRTTFETALLRACVPAADYDLDALMLRVTRLEQRLAGQDVPIPVQHTQPAAPAPVREKAPVPEEEEPPFLPDEPVFDDMAPPFGEPAPTPKTQNRGGMSGGNPFDTPSKPQSPVNRGEPTAVIVFGDFMRILRKSNKNGVLFTMCADLIAAFEGTKLVLTTDSETVFRALGRENHRETMRQVFTELNVADFEVRLAGAQAPASDGLEQFKKDFSDYKIDVK